MGHYRERGPRGPVLAEYLGRHARGACLDEHKEEIKESPEKPIRCACTIRDELLYGVGKRTNPTEE